MRPSDVDALSELWSLPEPTSEPVAPEDLAVFRAVIDRHRDRLPGLARAFAEAAKVRAAEVFGMQFDEIEELVGDVLVAVDAFIEEGAAGQTDGPRIAALRAKARTGARHGTPVEAVIMAYHLGAKWFWIRLREGATEEEVPALDRVTPMLQSFTQHLVLVLTQASYDERQGASPTQRALDADAVAALLAGRGDPASRWCALVMRSVPPAGVDVLDPARAAACEAVPGAVGVVKKGAGLVLLPTAGASITELRDRVDKALAPLLVIGGLGSPTPPVGVRDASSLAGELAALALRTGRRTGVHGIGSLLIDYALDRQPELRGHLAGLLTDLPADLRETLERWVNTRDRKAVAAALSIHPNTVGYRLRRIGEVTGVDPSSPEGSLTLHAALTALTPRTR